jgi:hypothetical protein
MILRWPAEEAATLAAILCLPQKPVKEDAARRTVRAPGTRTPCRTFWPQPAAPGARAQLGDRHGDGTALPATGYGKR